jgi:hypothetical protein
MNNESLAAFGRQCPYLLGGNCPVAPLADLARQVGLTDTECAHIASLVRVPALVAKVDSDLRLSRAQGTIQVLATHRLADFQAAGAAGSACTSWCNMPRSCTATLIRNRCNWCMARLGRPRCPGNRSSPGILAVLCVIVQGPLRNRRA